MGTKSAARLAGSGRLIAHSPLHLQITVQRLILDSTSALTIEAGRTTEFHACAYHTEPRFHRSRAS